MILTDYCRVDFEKWLNDNYNSETIFSTATGDYEGGYFENDHTIHDLALYFEKVPYLLNALIIEFFDNSELLKGFKSFENIFYREYRRTVFEDRKKATEQAIIKANEIYNEKKA